MEVINFREIEPNIDSGKRLLRTKSVFFKNFGLDKFTKVKSNIIHSVKVDIMIEECAKVNKIKAVYTVHNITASEEYELNKSLYNPNGNITRPTDILPPTPNKIRYNNKLNIMDNNTTTNNG